MVDVEEMKPSDVAETLDISIPALNARLHRARLYVGNVWPISPPSRAAEASEGRAVNTTISAVSA